MLANNTNDGIRILADIPGQTEMPPSGWFAEVFVWNWHGIRTTDSRVMSDASVPAYATLTMADGSELTIWPNGTFVMNDKRTGQNYSLKITPNGVVPNPYRS